MAALGELIDIGVTQCFTKSKPVTLWRIPDVPKLAVRLEKLNSNQPIPCHITGKSGGEVIDLTSQELNKIAFNLDSNKTCQLSGKEVKSDRIVDDDNTLVFSIDTLYDENTGWFCKNVTKMAKNG